jgi:hypothetical protein
LEDEVTGAGRKRIILQGRLPSGESLKAMSDCELEERLTVTAAAPGNRQWQLFRLLLRERDARRDFLSPPAGRSAAPA